MAVTVSSAEAVRPEPFWKHAKTRGAVPDRKILKDAELDRAVELYEGGMSISRVAEDCRAGAHRDARPTGRSRSKDWPARARTARGDWRSGV